MVRIVRELAQVDTPEAYEIVRLLMRAGEKDNVRLAAARTILQIAGVPLTSSTSNDGGSPSQEQSPPPAPSSTPTSALLTLVKTPGPSSGDGES